MAKATKYSQQFKQDAVQYRLDHQELSLRKAAQKNWMKAGITAGISAMKDYNTLTAMTTETATSGNV